MEPAQPPRSARASELALGRDLLRAVSRTFYLSLRILPGPVRGPLSLAYLLARASDTLADHTAAPVAERRRALDQFSADLAALDSAAEWPTIVPDHPGERELLRRWPEILDWMRAVENDDRALIRSVMRHILDGQRADLDRTTIASEDELELYLFQVAGCVGEFWTRLCDARLPHFGRVPVEDLILLGVGFGKGLQLVNIVRDVPRDAALGRSYLPGVPADASADAKWSAAQPWISRCAERLTDGERYASDIAGLRCRFAVWLPLLLARATLARVRSAGPAAMLSPVRIPRRDVRRLALQALWRSGR